MFSYSIQRQKIQSKVQVEYKSATKRSIKLDIQAEDVHGRLMDIEIQRSDRGSGVRRARFHSSMIDRTLLSKGEDFEELVDTYVIFITENDKFGKEESKKWIMHYSVTEPIFYT